MTLLADRPANGWQKKAVPKDVQEALADLRDYLTHPETNQTTPVAGEAISGIYRLYHLGEKDKVRQAYSALGRLRERNSETFGADIPIDHKSVYKSFYSVLECLVDAIERDFDKDLKQQLGVRCR